MFHIPPLPWMRHAACVSGDHHPDMWFPERGANWAAQQAKTICGGCTVKNDCLELALTHHIKEGIWGGTTRAERAEILRARRTPKTHCRHGHELTPDNTYVHPDGWRQCKTCRRGYVTDQGRNNGMRFQQRKAS